MFSKTSEMTDRNAVQYMIEERRAIAEKQGAIDEKDSRIRQPEDARASIKKENDSYRSCSCSLRARQHVLLR